MSSQEITVTEAAKKLNVGRKTLFQKLREKRIFNGQYPRAEFIEKGYFRIADRQYTLPGTHIKKYYNVTLVTGTGMALLNEIVANELDTNQQLLHRKRRRLQSQRCTRTRENTLLRLVSSN